jgi:hypothetical protein
MSSAHQFQVTHARDDAAREETTMTAFALLLQRCGLSQREASELLEVRLDTVKSWSSGRNPVRLAIINELRELHRKIELAGQQLAAMVQHPIDVQREESGEAVQLVFGLARSDPEARKLGFPCTGAHAAALGVAIAALPGDVEVEIVPRRPGETMTAGVQWRKPVAPAVTKLANARALRMKLEKKLSEAHENFVIYLTAKTKESRMWLEAELCKIEDFKTWLALGRTIEELETRAKAMG